MGSSASEYLKILKISLNNTVIFLYDVIKKDVLGDCGEKEEGGILLKIIKKYQRESAILRKR